MFDGELRRTDGLQGPESAQIIRQRALGAGWSTPPEMPRYTALFMAMKARQLSGVARPTQRGAL